MDRKIPIIAALVAVLIITPVLAVEVFDEAIFSQIPYSYTSYTSIPANKPVRGHWGLLFHKR